MNKDCTLLIGSCDSYSDLWDPFFELLNRFWPDLNYEIVLSTESSKYKGKYHNIINVNPSSPNVSWSQRIAEALKNIESEHVILMLDDFFLKASVDTKRVEKTLEWLKSDKKIATFTYWPISNDGLKCEYEGFEKRPKVAPYKVAAILGIWNKRKLLKYMDGFNENAWQWEVNATQRVNTLYPKDEFYISSSNDDQIFPYDFSSEGLFSGKWFRNTVSLFERLNIKINFEKRGFYDEAIRGLSPSIISSFEMQSAVIPYYALKNKKESYIKQADKVKCGKFKQIFNIEKSLNIIRWEPAIQWGFSIKNLTIKITYQNKFEEFIDPKSLFGTFVKEKEYIYFNKASPYMYIPTKENELMDTVEISGELIYPITKKELKNSFNQETLPKNNKDKEFLHLMWLQILSISEKTNHIKLNSEWELFGNMTKERKKSSEYISNGNFEERINLNKDVQEVTWLASKSGGYAIKNLEFYYRKNGKILKVDNKYISNTPRKIKKQIVFLSDEKIKFKNFEKVDELIVKGYFFRPIPIKILRKILLEQLDLISSENKNKQVLECIDENKKGGFMKIQPKVTIVIPVFNKQKKNDYLKAAIESALNQDYENLEIIVVNDGSQDKNLSREIALSYGDQIKYFEKENGGVSTALNFAIEKMSGDYFSWLSHDDLYLPNKISKQIEYLNENQLFGKDVILYSDYEVIDTNSKHISYAIKDKEELKEKPEYAFLRGAINGLTLLVPKKAFEKHGVFNPKLKAIQDYELWYRFAKTYKFIHIPETLVKSRYHASQVSNTSPRVLSEGNPFWLKMIKDLSEKDMERLEGSVLNFYSEMINFLKHTPYTVPLEYCEKQIKLLFKNAISKINNYSVDVIIPFHNRIEITLRAIASVEKQTFKNYNIILVNDGSTDNLKKIKEKVKQNNKIKFIDLKNNVGASAARNVGLDNANSDYIAFLDSDDEFLPDKLKKQLSLMIASGENFSHTSYIRELDGEEKVVLSGKDFGYKNKKFIHNCTIATPTVMFKREFLNSNNYRFDSTLTIGEDTVFWLTILKNHRLLGIEEPLTIVHAASTSAAINIDKQVIGMKTILQFLVNDEHYSNYDKEISVIANAYVNFVSLKHGDESLKNFQDVYMFTGGFFKRNIKRVIYFVRAEGIVATGKRSLRKVKRKLLGD